MPQPPDHDPAEVAGEDALVEHLRAGGHPVDPVGRRLAALRDHVDDNPPPPLIYEQLAGEHLITVPDPLGEDPAMTLLPDGGRVEYSGHVDFAWPPPTDPPARTAGQQDHSNPWVWAGSPADPPEAA